MIELGVRIEFYETVGSAGEPSKGYLGALYRDDGYRMARVPAVGEYIAAAGLRVADREAAVLLPFTGPPLLAVREIHHYPVPVREGKVPSYWASYAEPSANVILHVQLGRGGEPFRTLVRQFVADDWSYEGGPEGSEIETYGREAWAALRW
ncbi:hypothetical protein ACWF95_34055 [Streptomyces vinaceus]